MNENVKSANKDKANKTKATKGNKQNNKPKISFIDILKKNLIKFRNWLREWEPIGVLIAVVTLIFSLILGIIQIIQFQEERSLRKQQFSEWQEQRKEWEADRDLRKQQFSEWQEERKARAWQILTTRAIGNSGKKEALEFLASKKTALTGIDLSCTTNNGKWDDKNKKCEPTGVYLNELDLSENKHGYKVDLKNSKFEGADLMNARFDGADLDSASFDGAVLYRARFDGADLRHASFDGAELAYTSFDGASLWQASFDGAVLEGASFDGAYIEETDFSQAEKLDPNQLATAWIWADANFYLPILPPEWNKLAFDIILFCHPEISEKYVDDILEGKRKRRLPDPDKCKKWNEWPEETRKAWLEQPW